MYKTNFKNYTVEIDFGKYEKCESQCSEKCLIIDYKFKFIDKQCIFCYNQNKLIIQSIDKEKKE